MKEYALYKGENILAIGTIPFIARTLKVKRETVKYYGTNAYQNRLKRRNALNGNVRILVGLNDDEVEHIKKDRPARTETVMSIKGLLNA